MLLFESDSLTFAELRCFLQNVECRLRLVALLVGGRLFAHLSEVAARQLELRILLQKFGRRIFHQNLLHDVMFSFAIRTRLGQLDLIAGIALVVLVVHQQNRVLHDAPPILWNDSNERHATLHRLVHQTRTNNISNNRTWFD